jgi:hypothetical protein
MQVKDELDRLLAEWSDMLFFLIILIALQIKVLCLYPWLEL